MLCLHTFGELTIDGGAVYVPGTAAGSVLDRCQPASGHERRDPLVDLDDILTSEVPYVAGEVGDPCQLGFRIEAFACLLTVALNAPAGVAPGLGLTRHRDEGKRERLRADSENAVGADGSRHADGMVHGANVAAMDFGDLLVLAEVLRDPVEHRQLVGLAVARDRLEVVES